MKHCKILYNLTSLRRGYPDYSLPFRGNPTLVTSRHQSPRIAGANAYTRQDKEQIAKGCVAAEK